MKVDMPFTVIQHYLSRIFTLIKHEGNFIATLLNYVYGMIIGGTYLYDRVHLTFTVHWTFTSIHGSLVKVKGQLIL